MKRYDAYKSTSIPWIPEVPEHWEVRKIKYVFAERTEKGYPEEPILCATQKYGVIPQNMYENRVVVVNKGLENLKLVRQGNFVISLRSFQGGIEYAHYQGIISAAYTVLQLNRNIEAEYIKHLVKSHDFILLLQTCVTGLREGQNINYELLRKSFLPLPPLSEQRAIVAYIERKERQIDTYIARQAEQIERLKELRKTIISHAVTRGIHPYTRFRPTGIPWIPEVPEHWEMRKLRHFIEIISEKNHPQEPLLSIVRDQGVILRDITSKEENHNAIPDDLSGYKLIEKGHFAINKMKAWQGSYGVSSYRGIVSPAYYTCRLNFEHKAYFNLAIRSDAYVPFFTQYSKGIRVGQWDLSPIGLKEIPFFLPPLSEQRAIVAYIEKKTAAVDRMINACREQMELMKAYKQRLTSDAVTGRINVLPHD